jgi:predicted PurR-regulated permease PerM
VAAFWLLYHYYQIMVVLIVAVVLSTAISPITDWLHGRRVSRPLAVILVFIVFLLLIAGFVALLAPVIAAQVGRIAAALPGFYRDLRESMLGHPNFLIWRLGLELPPELALAPPMPVPVEGEEAADLAPDFTLVAVATKALFGLVAVWVLTFYWTLLGDRTIRSLLLVLPQERREAARAYIADVQDRLGAFVTGQGLLILIVGALALVAYLAIGLPYALVLAILAGLLEAVPLIGPGLGAIPAGLVAYSVDPQKVIWVLVATFAIQLLENNLLVPRVMKHSVGVNPLVTLLALTAFSLLFGLPGALIAIPVAAVLQMSFDRFLLSRQAAEQEDVGGRDELSVLRYDVQELIHDVRKNIRRKDDELVGEGDAIEDRLDAIASDLDGLLAAGQEGPEAR